METPRETTEAAPQVQGRAFKPTDKQWATLKIQPVEDRVFQNAAETDGKIAIDDDLVTPVFSPYTGRVTRLMVKAGDTVKKGDALFAVQATELAQVQNDLITAAAGLKTARAQLTLADTNEKRQHALYQAQGAAQKDWQQAQVDLATAQGGLSGAEIALAAVRSRLRILGKSDDDIDAIEKAPDPLKLDADTVVSAPIWRYGRAAPGRAGTVHDQRLLRRIQPGVHDRRPVQGLAGRQRAGGRRSRSARRRPGWRYICSPTPTASSGLA